MIVNIYIVYELISTLFIILIRPQKINLLGTAKLTKNACIDKYKYSGYGIGFDGKETFSFHSGGFVCDVIIFEADMSFSVHVDNKKKYILIFGVGPTQGLDGTILTAEKIYSINFTKSRK